MERYINYCRIFFISSLSSNNFKYNWLFEIGTIDWLILLFVINLITDQS